MENNQYDPITMLNQMVSEPYYLFHFLAFFSYIPVRCSASQIISPHFSSHLLHREIQAALAFSVLTVVKIFLVGIALVMDYHLALWYTLVFLGTSNQLTPLQLEALLTEGNTSRFWLVCQANIDIFYELPASLLHDSGSFFDGKLVEFRALSSSTCVHTSRFFPELSITYSNKNLSFGIVDLGLFPNAAEKYGISLGSNEKLPTYILFENAVEVTRFPEVDLASNPPITKLLHYCLRHSTMRVEFRFGRSGCGGRGSRTSSFRPHHLRLSQLTFTSLFEFEKTTLTAANPSPSHQEHLDFHRN
ncbi:hypothetical protein TEA_007422 [Camellia sinensis var. sinensis]|uniref:Thioredoxin domain-containing protein n=1 Tax=Camellia sinensis var. sinensis TaxID=542762 RepID=A0A4S4EBS5_CAMSN|nr:hypothetical protein TEA_007422 [Camellia sinensis var. sinensis]